MTGLTVALTVEQCWQRVPGGSGTYLRELSGALAQLPDLRVVGLAARHRAGPPDGALPIPYVASPIPRRALYDAWSSLRRPRAEGSIREADVVHATTWAVPGTHRPLVVTVHDLAFLREPGHFTPRGNRFFRRALSIVQAEAAAVIVPSQATFDDCVQFGLEPARLHVVRHGIQVPATTPDDVTQLRRRFSLTRPYVVWCGTLEPRKNLPRTVQAFARVAASHPDLDLVLVGPSGWGDTQRDVEALAAGIGADRIHLLGRLTTEDLHAAIRGASALALVSLWEGFGIPALEAMAHGVPVLTSRGSAMAEFVGSAGVLVDPYDVDEIAAGLVDVVENDTDARRREALRIAGSMRWHDAATRTALVYREVAAGGRSAS